MSLADAVMAQKDRLEAECHALLHRYVFNCGCTTQFLEDQLGADEADILLKLWAYGVNGDNDAPAWGLMKAPAITLLMFTYGTAHADNRLSGIARRSKHDVSAITGRSFFATLG
jgi:hypothetical protein